MIIWNNANMSQWEAEGKQPTSQKQTPYGSTVVYCGNMDLYEYFPDQTSDPRPQKPPEDIANGRQEK